MTVNAVPYHVHVVDLLPPLLARDPRAVDDDVWHSKAIATLDEAL